MGGEGTLLGTEAELWGPGHQCGTYLNSTLLSKARRFLLRQVCSQSDRSPTRCPEDRVPHGAAALRACVGFAGRLPPSPVRPTTHLRGDEGCWGD